MSISDRLDQIEADIPLAARSPEMAQHFTYDHGTRLLTAVRAVLDLHERVVNEGVCRTSGCPCSLPEWTCTCQLERHDEYVPWPCPTVRTITTALGEES